MKPNDLKEIYEQACDGKGYTPSDGQFKVWKQTLGWIDRIDLEAALAEWYGRESTFPMPAELKPLAMQAKQRRESRVEEPVDLVRWKCPDCRIYKSGIISPSDYAPRRCTGIARDGKYDANYQGEKICGALMIEVHRTKNYSTREEDTRMRDLA